jgi:hypothetical protein
MGEKLVELQRQAASTVDSLLHVTEDIGKYVIEPYGKEDGVFVELQCQILLKRCQSLEERLLHLGKALASFERPTVPVSRNSLESLDITRQIIMQNLQIVQEKKLLLQNLLSHTRERDAIVQESRLLEERAKLMEFQRTLRDAD